MSQQYSANLQFVGIKLPHAVVRALKARAKEQGVTLTRIILDQLVEPPPPPVLKPPQVHRDVKLDQPPAGPVAPRLSDRDAPPLPYVARGIASQRPAPQKSAISDPVSRPPPVSVIPGVSRHRSGDAKPQLSGDPAGMFRD